MLIKVIRQAQDGAIVEGIYDAKSYATAVHAAYPVAGKVIRVDSTRAANRWQVTERRAGNREYQFGVWCRRATEADVAKYGKRVVV